MAKKERKDLVSGISERIFLALDMVGYSAYRVAKEVDGITQQTFVNIKSGRNAPSTKVIAAFLHKFPTINGHWLLTGEGLPRLEPVPEDESGKLAYAQRLHDIPIHEMVTYIQDNEIARGFHKSDTYNLFLEARTQKKLIEKMNELEARITALTQDKKK